MAGLGDWARRKMSSGQPQPQPSRVAPPPPVGTPALAAPPPGYAWAFMQGTYVLIPLAAPPPPPSQPAFVPPVRQPSAVVPYVPQPITSPVLPGHAGPHAETCFLVKPGDRDTYAELLSQTPELVPDQSGGFDAMAGRPSPQTMAELTGCAEALASAADPNPGAPLRSFAPGASLLPGSQPLKGN
jgi:hypothetical protein